MSKFNEADRIGQEKALPVIKDLFKNCELQIEQHIDDNGRIDIFVTATTQHNITKTYAIECKDRWFSSTTYEDCMLNPDKYGWLMAYKKLGYKPLFFNSFSDDTYMIWDVSQGDWDVGMFKVPKTTVVKGEKVYEPRYLLPTDKCIAKGNLISQPKN